MYATSVKGSGACSNDDFQKYHIQYGKRRWPHWLFATLLNTSEHEIRDMLRTNTQEIIRDPAKVVDTSFPKLSLNNKKILEARLRSKCTERARQKARRAKQRPASEQHSLRVGKKVIWVAYPDYPSPWNVSDSETLCITVSKFKQQFIGGLNWLDESQLRQLPVGLSPFYKIERDQLYLHQGLATALIAKSITSDTIELYSWEWLVEQLREDGRGLRYHMRDDDGGAIPTIIILHFTTAKPPGISDALLQIQSLQQTLPVRSYPSFEEYTADQEKTPDIRVLDSIAEAAKGQCDFRPATCYGAGACALADDPDTFIKRAHSCGSAHTFIQNSKKRGFLQCRVPGLSNRKDPEGFHWFHQRYISSAFEREFRVLVVMEDDPKGTRGRSGRVIAKVTKKPNWVEKSTFAFRGFSATDLDNEHCRGWTENRLDAFVIAKIEEIRRQPEALTQFESFEVATCPDISFDHGRPWIVEPTRSTNAHFFSSSVLAEPHTEVCEKIAGAWCSYLRLSCP